MLSNTDAPTAPELNLEIIKPFLDANGVLISMPSKFMKRREVLKYIASRVEKGRKYTEKEFNELLESLAACSDPCTLRRELYDAGFVERKSDGTGYHAV